MSVAIILPGTMFPRKCFLFALCLCSPLLLMGVFLLSGLAAVVGSVAFTGAALNAVLLFGIHAPAWFLALFIAISGGLVLKGGHA